VLEVHHVWDDHGVFLENDTTSKAYIRRDRLQDPAAYPVM